MWALVPFDLDPLTGDCAGRCDRVASCSSAEAYLGRWGDYDIVLRRCPYYVGRASRPSATIQCGEPRTCTIVPPVHGLFETRHTPIAVKRLLPSVVQVLAALTEGVGINAATRLYGVSKNSIYRWQERLSGLKNAPLVRLEHISFSNSLLKAMSCTPECIRRSPRTRHKDGPWC